MALGLDFFGDLIGAAASIGTKTAAYRESEAGIATERAGSALTMSGATAVNAAQQAQIGLEFQVEQQRKNAMEVVARRNQLENIRKVQQIASQSRAAASAAGALFGSGAKGGQASVAAQGAWQGLGVQQQLEIGENVFGINRQISQKRIEQAQADLMMKQGQFQIQQGQFQVQGAQALGNLGTGIGQAASAFGKLASIAFPGFSL